MVRPERSDTDQLRLEEIHERSTKRRSLALDNEYEETSLDLLSSVSPSGPSGESNMHVASSSEPVSVLPNGNADGNGNGIISSTSSSSSSSVTTPTTSRPITSLKPELRADSSKEILRLKKITTDGRRFAQGGAPKSRFGDVKFSSAQSILETSATWSNPFAGFYVLFWLGVGFLILTNTTNYIMHNGWKFELLTILLTDLVKIGLTDLWMYLSIWFVFGLQYLIKLGYVDWESTGWVYSSLYEFTFLICFMLYAEHMNFPWIGKIFLYLHSLVLLMKMHSYSFYNGYLWKIEKELEMSRAILKKNDNLADDEAAQELVTSSIAFCEFELKSQSVKTPFPQNITASNFFWYTMFPTVVYAIDFPRTEKIRWTYVAEKLAAIFGVITLMLVIAQQSMYPLAIKALELRELPIQDRIKPFALILLDIIPSFLLIYILDFYLIWDAILNCIAELSRFGDREFYGFWWNCVSWDQFSRLWNVPVHRFLLRHVYHSSISALHLSKNSATIFTFLLSSVVHEGAMFVIFHRFRGYLFLFQMLQLPLVAISRTKYIRDKKTLGNVVFWFGIAFGPSLMCTLYLTF